MKAWLDESAGLQWADLQAMQCQEWLWIDMEEPGVHLAGSLPSISSRQLSHAWGWGDGVAVRVRIDPDLDSPAVAILRWDASPPPGISVLEIAESNHQAWPVGNGRANIAGVDGLNLPNQRTLRTLVAPVGWQEALSEETFEVTFVTG